MTKVTEQLTQWVINKIKNEYIDDIALLVAVDSCSINGDGHGEPFDYFIPATERGNELAQTFIIGSIGSDLYPRSWERTERTAALDDPATPCLGSAKILYARSKEDEARFEAIRQKLFDNLNDPDFTYRKALENLDIAMNLYKTMMFEEQLYRVRALAGYIHSYLTVSVACLNKTYRRDWHNGVIREISSWKELPEGFVEYYQRILAAHTVSELRNLSYLLIAASRQFIARHKPERTPAKKAPNYHELADWYQELRTWWNRLSFFCSSNDSDAAFSQACKLQSELDMIEDEFGLSEMDLLGCFDNQDLKPLARRAAQLEAEIASVIGENGVKIRQYDTLDAFLSAEH